MDELTEKEKAVAAAQVEHFLRILEHRHGIQLTDVAELQELLRWARARKALGERIKTTSMLSLIGLLVSALALAVWEGIKSILASGR